MKDNLAGILTGTVTFGDLWTQLWTKIVSQVLVQIGLVQTAAAPISGIFSIFGIALAFQHGGSAIFTRPTPIMVGESGAERVSVTPLAGAPAATSGGVTVINQGLHLWDEITYAKFVRRLQRDLTGGPVSRVG